MFIDSISSFNASIRDKTACSPSKIDNPNSPLAFIDSFNFSPNVLLCIASSNFVSLANFASASASLS